MAQTVKIQSIELNVPYGEHINHVLQYVKEDGAVGKKLIFQSSPLFNKVISDAQFLTPGKEVDLGFKKLPSGQYELEKIEKKGSLTSETKKWGGGKREFTPKDPDRELSMELSGLMQAIISKEGTEGLKEKTMKVFTLKQELMSWAKTKPTESTPEIKTTAKSIPTYKINDDSPY